MSIKRLPSGQYRARYRDEAGKEHAHHASRKVDAQRWLDEVTASMVTGTYTDPVAGRITFAAFFREWAARQVWTTGTQEAAKMAADSVTFADLPMRTIRPSHVQVWVKAMSLPAPSRKAGLAASTIRTRFNYVHMAMRAAVADRVIPHDPSANIALPRVRRSEAAMTIPSAEQVGQALQAAPEHFQAFVAVCVFAGLRLGEAAGLQLGDVDFLRRTISVSRQVQGQTNKTTEVVPPKYGSERDVYVADELLTILTQHVQEVGVWGKEQWLFGDGGNVFHRNSAGNLWRKTREAVGGMDLFTLHDLRHYYASGLISEDCDVVTVQRALGHSSPSITLNVYMHLWPSAEDRTRTASATIIGDVLRTISGLEPANRAATRGDAAGQR